LAKVAGYWNYDKSEFAAPSALLDDDDAMEALWNKEYSLAELVSADQFKSYDDLKKRLDYVLGNKKAQAVVAQETEYDNYAPTEQKRVSEEDALRKLEQQIVESNKNTSSSSSGEEEDDALNYFSKLAEM
jgi:hypothetical protein